MAVSWLTNNDGVVTVSNRETVALFPLSASIIFLFPFLLLFSSMLFFPFPFPFLFCPYSPLFPFVSLCSSSFFFLLLSLLFSFFFLSFFLPSFILFFFTFLPLLFCNLRPIFIGCRGRWSPYPVQIQAWWPGHGPPISSIIMAGCGYVRREKRREKILKIFLLPCLYTRRGRRKTVSFKMTLFWVSLFFLIIFFWKKRK